MIGLIFSKKISKKQKKYKQALNKMLKWVSHNSFEEVRSVHQNYKNPKRFFGIGNPTIMMPDATAKQDGHKSYFEVVLKQENIDLVLSRWRLWIEMAQNTKGHFHMFIPNGNFAFTKRMLQKISFNYRNNDLVVFHLI